MENENAKKKTRSILLIIVIAAIIGIIWYLERDAAPSNSSISSTGSNGNSENAGLEGGIASSDVDTSAIDAESSKYPAAPELAGIVHWINSEPLKISDLGGKVVIVDFWTYSCINCIRTLPYLKEWHEKYADDGLVIIGVHTPEFKFEKENANVENAVKQFGIKYPVAMDNNYATWKAYANHFWPHKFLIDKNGRVRYDHVGEGGYAETEDMIVKLLKEAGKQVEKTESKVEGEGPSIGVIFQTQELYAGYSFARVDLGNTEGYSPDNVLDYEMPSSILADRIYFAGKWKNNDDNMQHAETEDGQVILRYTAKSVHIVASSTNVSEPSLLEAKLNGESLTEKNAGKDVFIDKEDGKSYVRVDQSRLYNVIGTQADYGTFALALISKDEKFMIYTYTFGS